jgi:hypothetical protein
MKKIDDLLKMRGDLTFNFKNSVTGEIRTYHESNLVVTAGKNHIADQLAAQAQAQMSHMAVGTGTTAATAGDTALETELDRNALTSLNNSSNTVTYVGDWAAGDATGAITEAGILNSASAGTMLVHSVFAAKNKGAGDSLTITWVLTIS